jgi:signal transduction histidine kinase
MNLVPKKSVPAPVSILSRPASLAAGAVRTRDAELDSAAVLRSIQAPAGPRAWLVDSVLALLITGIALAGVVRLGERADGTAALLACAGAICLAWRRSTPVTVLLVSGGSFCLYQTLGYPHTAPLFSVLVALYTVAAHGGALVPAGSAVVVMLSALGSSVSRHGWSTDGLDDELLAYVLSLGAACALGYAVQLSRARTELLRQQAARLATEHAAHEEELIRQEQARIARELHDVVAHQVSVITALAAGADRSFEAEPQRARRALNSIELAGREAMIEMRRLLRVLRTEPGEFGFVPQPSLELLPALLAKAEGAGLPVRLSVHGVRRVVPAGVDLCAYRIVQEALTNTLKHAGPAHASVSVGYEPAALELRICDDGRGMGEGTGQGLVGMRERAMLVGGQLIVGAGPAGGVEVHARLPLADEPL